MFHFRAGAFARLPLGEGSLALPSLQCRDCRPAWAASARARRPSGWPAAAKRAADITLAFAALALLGPLALVFAALIRLDSRGPVLFRQSRIGRDGVPFELLKFRTMYHDPNAADDCRQATRNDPRVTRIGSLLRRASLDEIPQFINVLRGDMSVVGPRPHAPGTRAGDRRFEDVTHRYAARHLVRPGMTGLAQIRGWRGETDTEEKLLRRVDCDLEYIATWSLRLDLIILWRTIFSVLHMRNAY